MSLLLAFLIRLLCSTLRITVRNADVLTEFERRRRAAIVLFWHGSMLLAWWWLRGRNTAALVSRSRDGALLAGLLTRWRYHLIRGSSSRGGKEAMETMAEALQKGYILCITPDGPRGPRRRMKMGALRTSQKTGVPLIMLDVSVSSGWRLHSWDAFTIPRPFSRCSLTFSNPITTDPHLIPAELDVLRERLEDEMNETVRHEPDE